MIHAPTGMMPTIIFKCPSGFVCCSALLARWSLKPVVPKALQSPSLKAFYPYGTLQPGPRDRVKVWVKLEKW